MSFQNRIVDFGTKPASSFLANPSNPRKHPERQRRAVNGLLSSIGWVGVVCESARSQVLLDGHERLWASLDQGDDTQVPYISVDVTPEEEKIILATLDYSGEMADYDSLVLADLINRIDIESALPAIQETISDMVDEYDVELDMPELSLDEPESETKKTVCPKCGWEF